MLISKYDLEPVNWMCRFEDERYLHLMHKDTKKVRIIDKDTGELLSNIKKTS